MPDNLKNMIKIFNGPKIINPRCSHCLNAFPMHEKRFKKEICVFSKFKLKWQCRSCRKIDIRKLCRKTECA